MNTLAANMVAAIAAKVTHLKSFGAEDAVLLDKSLSESLLTADHRLIVQTAADGRLGGIAAVKMPQMTLRAQCVSHPQH